MNNFPVELLILIASFITERTTLLNIRCLSKRYKEIFTPLIGITSHTITMISGRDDGDNNPLAFWAIVPSGFIGTITALKIVLREECVYPTDTLEDMRPNCNEDELKRYKAVKSLELSWSFTEGQMSTNDLLGSILDTFLGAVGWHLESLILDRRSCRDGLAKFPLSFGCIMGLENLTVHFGCQGRCNPQKRSLQPFDQVYQLIRTNPGIRNLRLEHFCRGYPLPIHFLGSLCDLQQLSIRSVSLSSAHNPVRTLLKLRSLEHLQLSSSRNSLRMTYDVLWVILKDSDIKLRSIQTGSVSKAFLDYLRAFTGIRTLTLELGAGDIFQNEATIRPQEVVAAILTHQESLEYISVLKKTSFTTQYGVDRDRHWNSALLEYYDALEMHTRGGFPALKSIRLSCPQLPKY
ncbi:hypothetical protein AX16_002233 [Volvariella volvacea WC 439]|nr:hypothetical protein AX16_002233 [Volvariella volvacea WC 439]